MINRDLSIAEKNELWKKHYGNRLTGYDVFGRFVSRCGLEVYHILPIAQGGKDNIDNLIILNPASDKEKANNLSGVVNKKFFRILNNGNGIGKLIIN